MEIPAPERNMSDYCEMGDCSSINKSTCEKLPLLEDHGHNDSAELYDQDGCFFTHQLRNTSEYESYLQVGRFQ